MRAVAGAGLVIEGLVEDVAAALGRRQHQFACTCWCAPLLCGTRAAARAVEGARHGRACRRGGAASRGCPNVGLQHRRLRAA